MSKEDARFPLDMTNYPVLRGGLCFEKSAPRQYPLIGRIVNFGGIMCFKSKTMMITSWSIQSKRVDEIHRRHVNDVVIFDRSELQESELAPRQFVIGMHLVLGLLALACKENQ